MKSPKINTSFLKNIYKSQVKEAVRLGLQSAIAGALCYYLMVLLQIPERFLGVLSAILVIESSIGNTFLQAKDRLLATLVGAAIGFTFVVLIPWELGTILSLLISLFIINGISSFRPAWRYGVVAAVALALGSEGEAFELVLDRLISIGFGVSIGILVSFLVWPDTSEKRALRFIRSALKNTCDRFQIEFKNTKKKKNKKATKINDNFSTNINQAKKTADSIAFANNKNIHQLIGSTEMLFNSITIIQRVADRSHTNIRDKESGIEKNSEKIIDNACKIIKKFASKKTVSKEEIDAFSKLIKDTKAAIKSDTSDKELSLLRNTFMFGLSEIRENIEMLYKNFKEV